MLAEMPWPLMRMWIAYAELEPFGEGRADMRAGIIASTLANCNRDPKSKPEPFTIQDFMIDFDGSREEKVKPAYLTDPAAWVHWLNTTVMAYAAASTAPIAPD